MKRQTSLAIFGILFAAAMALGMVSISGFSQSLFVASTDMKAINHMDMMGHITLTATDQDGNILSYIQTDNIIVNVGENCVEIGRAHV
jgi:spore germination protein GerM